MTGLDGNYNVALDLLDLELRDVNGRHCGRIDDLELEDGTIVALLVGRGAWRRRLPRRLGWIGRGEIVRIAWEEVVEIEASVKLGKTERELGLNRGELRPARWLERIPGS
jgi:sporulation protein YlmC with PRC-barrel domain